MNKLLLPIALLLVCSAASAKVTTSSVIGDNMVLQQNSQVLISGTASPNITISVIPSWNKNNYHTISDDNGNWRVKVDTPNGSYDRHSITITDGEPITINDVMVGEVWLASGQSNMEMPLRGFDGCCIQGGYDEIAKAADWSERIRFYRVPNTQEYEPVDRIDVDWVIPSPENSHDFSAVAWYYAQRLSEVLDVPIGIVSCAYGGSRVESWLPREILETYPDVSLDPKVLDKMTGYLRPLLMYNAMFYPIKDYTYSGIIWYQGCSNVGSDDTYADRLVTMVNRWCQDMGVDSIPFYSVEIAPYEYEGSQDNMAPLLRKAQWEAVERLPNAAQICINDLVFPYERYNIHPSQKKEVGTRLGNLALNRTYGKKQFPVIHPTYKSHNVKDNEVWIAIDSPNGGICRNYDMQGFEIAGADRVFYPADDARVNWRTNEIVISSKNVPEPVAVRYCWNDFQIGNIHAANYLPLIPFRTDNW